MLASLRLKPKFPLRTPSDFPGNPTASSPVRKLMRQIGKLAFLGSNDLGMTGQFIVRFNRRCRFTQFAVKSVFGQLYNASFRARTARVCLIYLQRIVCILSKKFHKSFDLVTQASGFISSIPNTQKSIQTVFTLNS